VVLDLIVSSASPSAEAHQGCVALVWSVSEQDLGIVAVSISPEGAALPFVVPAASLHSSNVESRSFPLPEL
jgi:hypothetical protein